VAPGSGGTPESSLLGEGDKVSASIAMDQSPHEAWPKIRDDDPKESKEPVVKKAQFDFQEDRRDSSRSVSPIQQKRKNSLDSSQGISRATASQTGLMQQQEEEAVKTKKVYNKFYLRLKRICFTIVENKPFMIFGTLITVWALGGDDIKLLTTDKPSDAIFDGMVIFCIVFFSIEVVMTCIGKDDYFMGFFFILDVISTGTLFMDLTVVAEALFGGSDDDLSKARSSRTARVGAKMGRVVRVLRLIRIVKLFKVISSQQQNQRTRPPKHILDEDFDEHVEEEEDTSDKESLVGKKLSARMTQRTIVLVLSMLLFLPLLRVEPLDRLPTSGLFGSENVLQAYLRSEHDPSSRPLYEEAVLKMLYYHNWFTGQQLCPGLSAGCSNNFLSHTFWVGIGTRNKDLAFLRNKAENTSLSEDQVKAWEENQASSKDKMFIYGNMPEEVVDRLGSPWETECQINGIWHIGVSVLGEKIPGKVDYAVKCPNHLRYNEVERFTPRLLTLDAYDEWFFVFYNDQRPFARSEAAMSIFTTIFICVILCIAAIFFTSTANVLVLQPVENMIKKVEAIRDNPLVAMKMADDEFKKEEIAKKLKRKQAEQKCKDPRTLCRTEANEPMETVILEKTIIKLGSLLALGFGEAGANIVSSNMHGSSHGVNAMVEGSRVDCIVGIARILNFTTATEVLQGKVMTFVNQIAEIVHGVVDECRGAVNKNDGDTFLIIWRTAGMEDEQVSKMAEMSILAFAMVTGNIHRSPVLASYRSHPGLQQRLKENCRVDLSFGLHLGWAIEGAVGSEFKIDASYISPNVAIAASVERATRIYDVNVLISQTVVELCSKEMVGVLRLIDKVIIKGSKDPLELYALDLDLKRLDVDNQPELPITWNSHYRFKSRHFNEVEKEKLWNEENSIVKVLQRSREWQLMRKEFSTQFIQTFNMGYQNYSEGEWQVARIFLLKTHTMLSKKDGPSGALLRFMESPHRFEAPDGWRGVHPLLEEQTQ